jgi:protein O-GlcNAc transferase
VLWHLWRGEQYRHRKKRVGFLSADFREHPVGYLLIGLVEHLDSQRIESYAFSLGIRDGSELYRRYKNAFDHYIDCKDKPSHEIARLMRSMEIDMVIDLSGYTSGSRLDVLSHRPCPAQATYLGFPGGLNLPYVDYLIADRVTVPEEMQKYYREKILYLPHCYLPRDTSVNPSPHTPSRAEFGLPDDGLVFCSFNHDYKINPPMFAVWMDLLRENPKSVLWLMKLNEDAQNNLSANANTYGIDPARLIFATRVPRIEDHLARYRLVDVCLDTFPYNGHTTTSDALLAGVPVVTMAGQGFASRVATSLLSDAAETEFICSTLEQYKARVNLALGRKNPMATQIHWPASESTQASAFVDAISQA